MRIKGLQREHKRRKLRYGMRVDNASVRRLQLALLERARKNSEASAAR